MDSILFDEAIEKWRESLIISLRSEQTIKTYIQTMEYLNKFLQEEYNSMIYIEEIKTEDIENFFRYLKIKRNNSLNTIETHKRKIKTFYNFLIKKELIENNITDSISKIKTVPKPRVYLTYEEVEKIIENIKSPIIKTFYLTLYHTGLRRQEAINLNIDNVDLQENFIFVKYGKGSKSRRVPISKKLKEILQNYMQNIRPGTESNRFFATQITGKLSIKYTETQLKNSLKILGLEDKGITMHTFRHSFASALVKKKVNLKVIQKLLGHSDITVTAIYLNADLDDMKQAVEEL